MADGDKEGRLTAVAHQHKQAWERLFSVLGSSKPGKGVDGRARCRELAAASAEEREELVRATWGTAALEKVRPMLSNILSLEEQANRINTPLPAAQPG